MVHEHITQLPRIPIDINTPLFEGIERMKGPGNGCHYLMVYFIHVQLSFSVQKVQFHRQHCLSEQTRLFFLFVFRLKLLM